MVVEYNNIKKIHMEITNKCNAKCPLCNRYNNDKTISELTETELTLNDCRRIINKKLIKQLSEFQLCGNYGDPIIARETLELLRWVRSLNPTVWLKINTNGSARSTDWWGNIGKLFKNNGTVTFSIDGLKDTNHLYRRNTSFDKIIKNARAFIQAGGNADWCFIVFKHNQHQIDEARIMAKELGFNSFNIKTTRWILNVDEILIDGYKIEPPTHDIYNIEKSKIKLDGIKNQNSIVENYDIDCYARKEQSIYIDANGLVHPCCSLGYISSYKKEPYATMLKNNGGLSALNTKIHTIENILSNTLFNEIMSSWKKSTIFDGKIYTCSHDCGFNKGSLWI